MFFPMMFQHVPIFPHDFPTFPMFFHYKPLKLQPFWSANSAPSQWKVHPLWRRQCPRWRPDNSSVFWSKPLREHIGIWDNLGTCGIICEPGTKATILGKFEANVGSIWVNLSCMEHLGSIVCQLDYSWVNSNDISELRDQKLWKF
jgi:hypothetical protein